MSTKEDDFLPPLLPTDNPAVQASASTKHKLVVWLGFIVGLVLVYALVLKPHTEKHVQHVQEACKASWWTSFGPMVFVLLLFAWFWHSRRGQRPRPEQEEAMLAHLDGDDARARQLWLALASMQRGNPGYARVSRFNAASAAQALGDFDRARDEFLAIERSAGFLFVDGHRLLASMALARLFVLRGELDRAHAWLRSSRQRLERYRHDRTSHGVVLRLTECFLLAREGKHDEALQLLQSRWRRHLGGHEPGATLLLRAYLVARTSALRENGAVAPWVDALRTASYDVSHLWKEWPDLEAFAVENGLTARAASTAHA